MAWNPVLRRMRSAVRSWLIRALLSVAVLAMASLAGASPPSQPLLPPLQSPVTTQVNRDEKTRPGELGMPALLPPPDWSPPPPSISGFPSCLPPVRLKEPRPEHGPESVSSFLESVSVNDAALEVLVGQGRILTTRTDLTVPGKPSALIAVGDPT